MDGARGGEKRSSDAGEGGGRAKSAGDEGYGAWDDVGVWGTRAMRGSMSLEPLPAGESTVQGSVAADF